MPVEAALRDPEPLGDVIYGEARPAPTRNDVETGVCPVLCGQARGRRPAAGERLLLHPQNILLSMSVLRGMDRLMPAMASDRPLPGPVQLFQRVFCELRPEAPVPYDQLYSPEVIFEDPLHRADGLDAVRRHFERLNGNLRVCRFEYGRAFVEAGEAVLSWTMKLELRRGP